MDAAVWEVGGAGLAVLAFFGLLYLAILVLSIAAAVKVVSKAGYSGWWVLITLVPFVGFVMTLVFAFSQWPVLRELEALRSQRSGPWPGPSQGYPSAGPGSFTPPSGDPPLSLYSAGGTTAAPAIRGTQAAAPNETPSAVLERPLPALGAVLSGSADPGSPPRGPGAEAGGQGGPLSGSSPTGPTAQPSGRPPAGWFPTPDGRLRYWDGAAWTDHFS